MRILHVYTTRQRLKYAKRKFEEDYEDEMMKSSPDESLMIDGTLHRWATVQVELRGTTWNTCIIDEDVKLEDRARIAPLVRRTK
jgi:hypothetical protein